GRAGSRPPRPEREGHQPGDRRVPQALSGAMSPTGADGGDDDENDAFAEAVRGARPLVRGHERVPPAPPLRSRRKQAPVPAASPFVVEQAGDTITGRARDVAAKLLQELRGGAHAVDA